MNDWQVALERAQAVLPESRAVEAVVAQAAPGRSVQDVVRMQGGLGAVLHRIDLHPEPGEPEALVLRQLMPEWGETAVDLEREATTVVRLDRSSDVPVPTVHWSDPGGEVFGRPAMVMEFVHGHCLVADLDSQEAAAVLARTLARIHATSIDTGHLRRFETHADHPQIFGINPAPSDVVEADTLRFALERATPDAPVQPTLVHGDFHGGNVLWDGAVVTAVLDWPMATVANRWWDEAYAYMDTWLAHGAASAKGFRSEYREIAGDAPDPARQRFWDLTALIRALPSPGQWLDSYRHAGATGLTRGMLEQRYADLVARVV